MIGNNLFLTVPSRRKRRTSCRVQGLHAAVSMCGGTLIAITGAIDIAPAAAGDPGYRECFAAFREQPDRRAYPAVIALGLPVARKKHVAARGTLKRC